MRAISNSSRSSCSPYVAAAFTVQVPWGEVMLATLVPKLSLQGDFLLMIVAVFGTTISPYLNFWQPRKRRRNRASAIGANMADGWRGARIISPISRSIRGPA
jgi:Mn2+/Fe2+ NRAMP family transporter